MRPVDAFWLALPLVVAALLVREWRRPAVVAMFLLGLVVEAAQWAIEAFHAHGGLIARLERGSEIQGVLGRHLAFDDQVKALTGRSLCRPCDVPWNQPVTALWWFTLPLLTVAGLVGALRTGRTAVMVLPTATAISLAVPWSARRS
ncbi:hypothetical protein [Streptomyces sp. TE5632]